MQVVYFVNSGSEANDMAMMMARLYTGSFDIVALRNAYHGMSPSTMGLTAHSTWKYNVAQVSGSNSTRIQSPASSECTLLYSPTAMFVEGLINPKWVACVILSDFRCVWTRLF